MEKKINAFTKQLKRSRKGWWCSRRSFTEQFTEQLKRSRKGWHSHYDFTEQFTK